MISGPGLTIDSNGVIQINSQTVTGVMKLGQNATTAAAAFNGYTWPVAGGSAGQQLTTNATGVLSWSDPDGIPWTAKGEIVVATGANAQTLLTVGSDGQILVANSSTLSGLAYTSNYVPTAGATTAAFLPTGTTSNRPSLSPSQAGAIRYNASTTSMELWNGTAWETIASDALTGFVPQTAPTGSAVMPAGTTLQRDSSPNPGYTRFNTNSLELEFWNGLAWITASTDGTVTNVTGIAPISVATGTTTPVISLNNTAVVPGTYTAANITVDAQGRITAAANGSGGGGGTVTSIGITAGTGITSSGGPITTAGAITVGLANTTVTPGSYTSANITVDAQGRITTASDGGAGTITAVTGTAPIVSSGGATPNISLANTAVTPGLYTSANITVDAQGRITAASNGGEFASGTAMVFAQASAPTGWTQVTTATYNDAAIRLVTSAGGGTGGSIGFSTLFSSTSTYTGSVSITSGDVGSTTLSEAQLASHVHGTTVTNHLLFDFNGPCCPVAYGGAGGYPGTVFEMSDAGSDQSHTHSLVGAVAGGNFTSDFAVNYVDMIVATKN